MACGHDPQLNELRQNAKGRQASPAATVFPSLAVHASTTAASEKQKATLAGGLFAFIEVPSGLRLAAMIRS
jgi:hypothetical protein